MITILFSIARGRQKSQKCWEEKCIVPKVDPAKEVRFLPDWKKYINMTMKRSWKVSGLRNRSCAGLRDRKWRTRDVPRRRSSSGRHLLYGLTHVRCHFLIHTTKLSFQLSDWNVHRSLETVRSPWLTLSTLQRLQLPLSFISIIQLNLLELISSSNACYFQIHRSVASPNSDLLKTHLCRAQNLKTVIDWWDMGQEKLTKKF